MFPSPSKSGLARRATGRGYVAFRRVIHHHTIGIEAPAEGADGSLHALDPAARQAVTITLVEQWNHFFAKSAVQILTITRVMDAHAGVRSARADGKAVHAVIGLSPPAIEHGKIESAIQNYFLPARTR